jgi:hypothetical protein
VGPLDERNEEVLVHPPSNKALTTPESRKRFLNFIILLSKVLISLF